MNIVIKNAVIVSSTLEFPGNIEIRDGKIHTIASEISPPADTAVIDAGEKYVLPGALDLNVNVVAYPRKEKSSKSIIAATTKAGLTGGVTTVNVLVPQDKDVLLKDSVAAVEKYLPECSFTDYTLTCLLTSFTWDLEKSVRSAIIDAGIKMFRVGSVMKEGSDMSEELILGAGKALGENDLLIIAPEHPSLSTYLKEAARIKNEKGRSKYSSNLPEWAEKVAVERIISIIRHTSCPVLIQPITTAASLETIRKAKEEGVNVYAGTTLPYLSLSREVYSAPDGFMFAIVPPLREKSAHNSLWYGIERGLIHIISSGHGETVRKLKQSALEETGMIHGDFPGIAHMVSLIHSEGVEKWNISLQNMVASLCDDPAKLLNAFPRKGSIHPGADADLVIFDPDRIDTLPTTHPFSISDFSPYKGQKVKGAVDMVIRGGEVVFENGALSKNTPSGKRLLPQ